jgi:hypothetical protein
MSYADTHCNGELVQQPRLDTRAVRLNSCILTSIWRAAVFSFHFQNFTYKVRRPRSNSKLSLFTPSLFPPVLFPPVKFIIHPKRTIVQCYHNSRSQFDVLPRTSTQPLLAAFKHNTMDGQVGRSSRKRRANSEPGENQGSKRLKNSHELGGRRVNVRM